MVLSKTERDMEPDELGMNPGIRDYLDSHGLSIRETGRVTAEHKERYLVRTITGEFEAEITGHLRYKAESREDFPAVGDWVVISSYDEGLAFIHEVIPRYSIIKRQAVGRHGDIQVIASNIDYAFIVQAADRDFNINRLERYLTICHASRVIPVIILSKTDLISATDLESIVESIRNRIPDIHILPFSNESLEGFESIKTFIEKGKTYCLLGSSGVGKSTLVNNLTGNEVMKTGQISHSTQKGRHITSHRELTILANGGIIIDNPGMREVGITDNSEGLEITFDKILALATACKFKDCTHTQETGCRVLDAIEKGEIDWNAYQNYLKMEREKSHFELTLAEKRQKDKAFGKMFKDYKKNFLQDRFKK